MTTTDKLTYPSSTHGWCAACGEGWALSAGVHCPECCRVHTRVRAETLGLDPAPAARLAAAEPEARRRARDRALALAAYYDVVFPTAPPMRARP